MKDYKTYFTKTALAQIGSIDNRSRSVAVLMSVEAFLSLIPDEVSEKKLNNHKSIIQSGVKFTNIPRLGFVYDDDQIAYTISHDGRHRALALREAGVDVMPVELTSIQDCDFNQAIRWSELGSGSNDDILSDEGSLPLYLIGQKDSVNRQDVDFIRFPLAYDRSRNKILANTNTKPRHRDYEVLIAKCIYNAQGRFGQKFGNFNAHYFREKYAQHLFENENRICLKNNAEQRGAIVTLDPNKSWRYTIFDKRGFLGDSGGRFERSKEATLELLEMGFKNHDVLFLMEMMRTSTWDVEMEQTDRFANAPTSDKKYSTRDYVLNM